jgi:ABC-2 type transport system ATP-binding protein
MVRAHSLTRRFGDLVAVDDLTVEVKKGEVFGLVGPDGAGKTTTLRMLCALMDPTSGSAEVAGCDVQKDPQGVKDRIGYMAQRFGLYQDLTVEENMAFYADLFGISRADRDAMMPRFLDMTRMAQFRDRPAGKLSGGMKQKLALMCTLLHKPEILFLDEPTNGVDPVSRRDFWLILYELVKQGMTVFVTTAYLDEAERCDRVGLMDKGRLIQCDSPASLEQHLPETTWQVAPADLRAARESLRNIPGVLSVEAAGAHLHVFASPDVPESALAAAAPGSRIEKIVPSIEDVFIAHIRRAAKS